MHYCVCILANGLMMEGAHEEVWTVGVCCIVHEFVDIVPGAPPAVDLLGQMCVFSERMSVSN